MLDEATSSLDAESEHKVQEACDRLMVRKREGGREGGREEGKEDELRTFLKLTQLTISLGGAHGHCHRTPSLHRPKCGQNRGHGRGGDKGEGGREEGREGRR